MSRDDQLKQLRRRTTGMAIFGGGAVLTVFGIYMLVTFILEHVRADRNVYIDALLQFIPPALIAIAIIVLLLVFFYRRSKKQVTTLSEAIGKVAGGDYTTEITYNKNDTLSHVYRDFNKMTAELRSVTVLRNDFINNYSHEFKTPLSSIHGFAELLLTKDDLTEEERRTYLEIICTESERLSNLTSNTILLSRLTSQQIVTDMTAYDLGEQLRQCSIMLSKSWLDKKIDFTGEFPKVEITANRELLQHVWLNLLHNAVKYTPVGGEIAMTLSEEDGTALVRVTDTGVGMSSEVQAHIFDPYYQGDVSHGREGLGLGLSVAHQIVSLMGGSIIVKSEEGAGSEFTVTLPRRPQAGTGL